MIGLMPVADILRLDSCDADVEADTYEVADVLPEKRNSAHYPRILASIREHGITVPVLIIDGEVRDGHHRIAAAIELGLALVPWTDIELSNANWQ